MLTWQPARRLLRLCLRSAAVAAAPASHRAMWDAAAACRRTTHACHAGLELLQQGELPLSLMLCGHLAAAVEGQRGRELSSQRGGRHRSPQLAGRCSIGSRDRTHAAVPQHQR